MQLTLKKFTGPFDLLLSLVQGQELKITEISLSEVTEQYLQYLDKLEESNVEELADFLVVAAKLLYLKSKRLLPEFMPEEEEEDELESQLKLYKKFVDASKIIEKKWNTSAISGFRSEPARKPEAFTLPTNVSLEGLAQSMIQLVSKLAPPKSIGKTHIDKTVSLKDRIDSIRKLLKSKKSFRFTDALADTENKTDMIIGFLAILELVKQKSLFLEQDNTFGDIIISRT
jgi:segregation and condensation protein A